MPGITISSNMTAYKVIAALRGLTYWMLSNNGRTDHTGNSKERSRRVYGDPHAITVKGASDTACPTRLHLQRPRHLSHLIALPVTFYVSRSVWSFLMIFVVEQPSSKFSTITSPPLPRPLHCPQSLPAYSHPLLPVDPAEYWQSVVAAYLLQKRQPSRPTPARPAQSYAVPAD
ncbi:Uncharacterised protein [Salmonella bongori]|nr:Uncharacterised protein [Salmonella bongori]